MRPGRSCGRARKAAGQSSCRPGDRSQAVRRRRARSAALKEAAQYNYSVYDSGLGTVGLVFTAAGKIASIYLPRKKIKRHILADFPGAPEISLPGKVRKVLDNCMTGRGCEGLVPMLDLDRLGPFQRTVLIRETTVPAGKVISYAQLAEKAGFPGAARAAGNALAKNPFPLAIPCHRTVRSDGSLGGFGGGLEMKRALLEMEGVGFDNKGRVKEEFFVED